MSGADGRNHPAAHVIASVTIDGCGSCPVSGSGVDVAFLALSGVDLSACLFTGAHHLDQLRFEGHVPLDEPPAPWTRRRTIADEHHWRALPLPLSGRRTAQTRG